MRNVLEASVYSFVFWVGKPSNTAINATGDTKLTPMLFWVKLLMLELCFICFRLSEATDCINVDLPYKDKKYLNFV